MSDNIIQLNEDLIKHDLKDLVRSSVEETLNALLDHEADELVNASKYERTENRNGYRSGHYERNFTTTAGDVKLKVPKLKGIQFETAIIERYKRRECSVEEALIEMYLVGVSVRRVEDITEALWGNKVSPGTISNLNQKAYEHIETWRSRKLTGEYAYVYVDGIYLKRSWGRRSAERVCPCCYRRIYRRLPRDHRHCTVHFYRNVFSVVLRGRMREVSLMLKAIHAQENKEAAREKAASVVAKLREMKLSAAAKKVEDGVDETLTYMDFPTEHWTRIRTNNVTERVNREIKRRTKAIGAFPDGQSALMLVCARLRYVAASDWGTKRYLNMDHLFQMELMNNTETAGASAG